MIVLSETDKQALDRANTAYESVNAAKGTRALNKAETRFYATAEALFHVLRADQAAR